MNFQEVNEKRRAINIFDPEKAVSDKLLEEMIALASKAPSSFNLQPWNLLVLRDQAKKEQLKSLAWDQPKVVEAPVILVVLADKNGWQEGHPTVEKNWQEMLKSGSMQPEQREWLLNATKSLYDWSPDANLAFAAKNTGFFAMALMYAATSLGLETHPMDGFDRSPGFSSVDFSIIALISLKKRVCGLLIRTAVNGIAFFVRVPFTASKRIFPRA